MSNLVVSVSTELYNYSFQNTAEKPCHCQCPCPVLSCPLLAHTHLSVDLPHTFHSNGVVQDVAFVSGFFNWAYCLQGSSDSMRQYFIPFYGWVILCCVDTPCLPIYWLLGRFCVFAVMINAAVNVFVQVFFVQVFFCAWFQFSCVYTKELYHWCIKFFEELFSSTIWF